MKKYLFITSGISVFLILLFYFGNSGLLDNYLHRQFPVLIIFFFLQSLIISWLLNAGQKSNWDSPGYALGTVTFRLLTGMMFLIILYVLKVEDIRQLLIQFTCLYLVYLIFELFAVLSNLRRN
ncbi:MAG: hypothetical protein ACJA08_001330 [Cyclobacteriaceae bacterium]|jgi:hypothetical protein